MASTPPQDWREVLIVEAALRTGLLAAFLTPASPAAVAARLDLDARATRVTALALADLGYLTPAGAGVLAAAPAALGLIDERGEERDAAARIHVTARLIAQHARLGDALLGAAPVPPWRGDRGLAEFTAAMRATAGERVGELVEALTRPHDGARLLDIGGGPGVDAAALAGAGWDVTVLDLPEVLAATGGRLAEDGVRAVAGDATAHVPSGPWDAILIANVLQLLGPDRASALVARAVAELAPDGVLGVLGIVRDLSPHGRLFAVGMLLSTDEGDTHESEDITGWIRAAGLQDVAVAEFSGGRILMTGRAA